MATYAEDLAAVQAAFLLVCQILLRFKGFFGSLGGIPGKFSGPLESGLDLLNDFGRGDVQKLEDRVRDCFGRNGHCGYYNHENGRVYYDKGLYIVIPEFSQEAWDSWNELLSATKTYYTARQAVYSHAEHRNTLFRSLRDALLAYDIDLGEDGDHIAQIRPAIRSIPASNNDDDRKKKFLVKYAWDEYSSYRMYRERR